MGRLLTILGVLVLLAGIAGTAWAFVSPLLDPVNSIFNPAGDAVQAAIDGPKAEDLCEPGERIETEEGPSSRTVGGTWGRPVTIYCVDSEGSRREVTARFAGDLFGQAFASMPAFIGGLGLSICFSSLIVVGIVLLLIGGLLTRRSRQPGMVMVGGIPDVQVSSRQAGAVDVTRYVQQQSSPGGDLTAKLRQLEDARSKGLISADEYDRLRQQILDSMG
jgi:hypothetical protein